MRAASDRSSFFSLGSEIHRGHDYSHFFPQPRPERPARIYHCGAPAFSASVSTSAACTRDSVKKCIARKYLPGLTLWCSPVSPSPPFPTCSNKCIFRRCVRIRAGNVNISLLAPRASPHVHVYNGGNCAEFQPLKCVERGKRGKGGE